MSSSHANTTSTKTHQNELPFINNTAKDGAPGKKVAQKKSIRSQAAKASTGARLETTRQRAEERSRQPGQRVFPVRLSVEPLPRIAVEQHQNFVTKYRDREDSITLHSHILLGGSIPVELANTAILAHFFDRFKSRSSTERPWVELVMAGTTSRANLASRALQANATALYANDARDPEIRNHATKLYLSTIVQLQSALRSPRWRDSVVLYTCMIISLYESIQGNDPAARRAHVSGVAHLIQQKGPESFIYGLEHKTFRYYRINILMMCLMDRQTCFLAETQWRDIPFSGDCPPKTVLDLLIDILAEVPGVLFVVESMKEAGLGRYALIQKAFELSYWVRRLISDLERWKENSIWTYPTICTTLDLKNLDLLTLCKVAAGLVPYDAKLGEALNCYATAHLILTRIANGLTERSFVIRTALRPPYSIRELILAIILVSEKHISNEATGMVSLIVTTFPLKVAQNTTELHEPEVFKTVQELLDQVNNHFASRYNINYSVPREKGVYGT